ncbi:DUF6985 domain-containing protein [Vreelandella sulfidaeris]|uniref:DUF6985 domain-containing protein n=1 Tax=Vreelandella sulfidaeris TaxID=115553 RepID=UPI0035EB31E2
MTKDANTATLDDPIFGEMAYKHSWYRKQRIHWWKNSGMVVQITAHAYSGEGISAQQRASFSEYEEIIKDVIKTFIPSIIEYIQEAYKKNYSEKEVFDALTPRNVLFMENGDWGILFDADVDIEQGVALYKENDAFKVGSQDDFL